MPRSTQPSTDPDAITFCREIRRARYISGLTMDGLAGLAELNGHGSVANIESGRNVHLTTAVRIARALGLSMDHLFGLGEYARR